MDPKDRVETVAKTKAGAMREKGSDSESAPGSRFHLDPSQIRDFLEEWPPAPKKVAEEMIKRYGDPNEATPTLLIWHDNRPWKRTVITADETPHNFPTPHTDP